MGNEVFDPGAGPCHSPLWSFGKDPGKIAVRIETVFFRGLDQAEQDRTAPGPAGGVGEQEILSGDHKGHTFRFLFMMLARRAAMAALLIHTYSPCYSPLFGLYSGFGTLPRMME